MPDKSFKREDRGEEGRIPPQSLEAEESLLSAVLIDNTTLLDILDVLSPEDFYRTAHQRIFEGVTDLFNRSEPVDLVTLANTLRNKGKLEEIGGAAYLAHLTDTVPVAVNALHYARIIHGKACLRRLIEKSNRIIRECFENGEDVDSVIDFAQKSVFEVAESQTKKAFYPIRDVIEKNIDTLEELQGKNALVTGVPSGFDVFDGMTSGLQPSDLIILAARPGMGKTALALNIAKNAASEGKSVAIFSLEMSKEQLTMRMLCSRASVDSSRLRSGYFSREDWDNLTEAAGELTELPIYIDDSPDLSAMDVRAKVRRLDMERRVGLVIIDYIQLMVTRQQVERRDLEISGISRALKGLAKEMSVPVMALSQLNRKLEERADKRPQLSDLRESGALEQDADVVAFIYRDDVYNRDENNPEKNKAELIIAKQRNGPTGTVPLIFLRQYTRFESMAAEDYDTPDFM